MPWKVPAMPNSSPCPAVDKTQNTYCWNSGETAERRREAPIGTDGSFTHCPCMDWCCWCGESGHIDAQASA